MNQSKDFLIKTLEDDEIVPIPKPKKKVCSKSRICGGKIFYKLNFFNYFKTL